jgi:glyoxylase-like metal-dependent hydrolase (beta-lactamase superfamily II)
MREVLPGVYHWEAMHPRIHFDVSSYWLDEGGVLIDPLAPPDAGIDWFASRPEKPQAVVLSNRHHLRDSLRFWEEFGCPILCTRAGLHEFEGDERVEGFDPGDTLPGGIVAHELGGICPDDTALYLPDRGALAFADGVVRTHAPRGTGELGFVPDSLMDDPPGTKRALLEGLQRLVAELDFENVLLAHGEPLIGDGRVLLLELIDAGGRTAFELGE